jgi:hypothetical protein
VLALAYCLYLLGYANSLIQYLSKWTLLWWFNVASNNKMYLDHHVECPIFLLNFQTNLEFLDIVGSLLNKLIININRNVFTYVCLWCGDPVRSGNFTICKRWWGCFLNGFGGTLSHVFLRDSQRCYWVLVPTTLVCDAWTLVGEPGTL